MYTVNYMTKKDLVHKAERDWLICTHVSSSLERELTPLVLESSPEKRSLF